MPLTAELETLITELAKADPAGAKEMRANLEKFPTLQKTVQEGVLRQSDYDRKHNELKADVEYGKTMKTWADTNVPKFDEMKTAREAAEAKVVELEAKVAKAAGTAAAAAAASGETVDAATLTAAVMEKLKGEVPTKTELAALIAAEAQKQTDVFYKTEFPRAAKWQAEYTNAQIQYNKETGNLLDDVAFATFMQENKIASPKDGLERFMEPAKRKKEIEDKAEQRVKEIMAERGVSSFPGSSGPGDPGHLRIRLEKKDPNDPLFKGDVELGDNSMAAAAAAELTTEGK